MDGFTKKTLSNSRGLDYTYWVRRSFAEKPALLLHHGFPDDHGLWINIIPYLRDLEHTIIVPDLLGYGETSKPSDAQLYNTKAMAQDMMEILDNEKQQQVISVGHDWGSTLAQRVALFHPDRVVGLIILNVAYKPPAEANIKKTNELLVKTTGLPRLAYQEFFTSPHAHELLEANLETAFHALNGSDEGTKNFMEDLLCHDGALEAYIRNGKKQPLKAYAQRPGFKETWISRMRKDGLIGPLNWYNASVKNHHWNVEKELPQERYRLDMPVLFIGCTKDAVCLTQYIQIPRGAGLLPDLTVEEIESGHWQTFEAPEKSGPIIAGWLKKRAADFTAKL